MVSAVSSRIVGRVLDENSVPFDGLRVSVEEPGNLWGSEIGHGDTDSSGNFGFSYISDTWSGRVGARQFEVVVKDPVLRELRRVPHDDPASDVFTLDTIKISRADVEGFEVTLGTGTAQLLSEHNAIAVKIDRAAFEHAASLFQSAQKSIVATQLEYKIPVLYNADPELEEKAAIFTFGSPELDAEHLRKVLPSDLRPERLMLDAADRGVEIRILLHGFDTPLFIRLLVGAILLPLGGTDGLFSLNSLVRDPLTDLDEVKQYFDAAGRTSIKPHAFFQSVLNGVFHNKLVLVDDARALSIGSPYKQNYNDSPDHFIDAPRRGAETEGPRHDASFSFSGPAVADLHKTLELYWNKAVPADPIAPLSGPPPSPQPELGDEFAGLQLVRTISAATFDGMDNGEKGILEAYLRAIHNAVDYVYLENQYFTDDNIGAALVKAMNANPDLQVIMMVNIKPDVPTYPFKQRRLITRIRKGISVKPERFGVFTRWTHEPGQPRPRMLPVYLHAKLGVVNNTWATIGSANLDGLSLDSSLLSDYARKLLPIREQRAIELNGVMFNGVQGHEQSEIVDIVRRTVWAEHLGYRSAVDQPDIEDDELKNKPADGWLGLWRSRAKATLAQLIDDPTLGLANMAQVLESQAQDSTFSSPRHHLDALGIKTYKVVPLKETRSFIFRQLRGNTVLEGAWDPKTPAATMDYD